MADTTPEREELARRIRALRKARDLSIQKLAALADMSPGYLSEVERGMSEVSGVKLARMAEHLGVSTDYLLSGRAEPANTATVEIPPGLSEAAQSLNLTYAQTLRLLEGKNSLVARRSTAKECEWTKEEWVSFYSKVKNYL
jgi:transcriptional regulator with XRE-family HTH domain